MHQTPQTADRVLHSRWFTGGILAGAALLVSPTFVLGYLSSTAARGALLGLATVAYAAVFHAIFEGRTPVGVDDVAAAYHSLALWTAIIGSAAPFAAGMIFRSAWKASSARQSAVLVAGAFFILAAGSHAVTKKADALSAASNVAVGKSQALSTLEAQAAAIINGRPDSPEAWAARFLASKVAAELLGVRGPQSIDDFVRHLRPLSDAGNGGQ